MLGVDITFHRADITLHVLLESSKLIHSVFRFYFACRPEQLAFRL